MKLWKDISSYSRTDKVRIPNAWELSLDSMRIVVHRHRDYPPDRWVVSCRALDIEDTPLENKNAGEAQDEAVEVVHSKLKKNIADLKAATEY